MDVFRPGGLELTDKAADFIKLKPGERVLDIGYGLGTSLRFLRDKYNIDAFGVDINPSTILRAGECLDNTQLYCADACDLPFGDGFFDAVFMECVLTLTHSAEKALEEAARVVVAGGYLVIASIDGAETLLEQGRIGRAALCSALNELGFDVVLLSDESAALRSFVAEAIFVYDSLENYIRAASAELGGAVLSCDVPIKGSGYILLIARKKSV